MYQIYIKRPADIALSAIILALLSPIYLITALLIKLISPGPILFKQQRTGLNGKCFTMYKFRSMTNTNNIHDTSKENELTTIGKLRALSLDELPQFINVIKGEMAFIGPRPWITQYYEYMNKAQRKRISVRPGITGLAQVHGRNSLSIHQKIEYDLGYIKRIGLREDAKIVFLTVKTLFNKRSRDIEKIEIHNELNLLKNQRELLED